MITLEIAIPRGALPRQFDWPTKQRARRAFDHRSKEIVSLAQVSAAWMRQKLDAVQQEMFNRALVWRQSNTRTARSYDELKAILAKEGGFVRCFFKPDRAAEAKIKDETKATVRCIPFVQSGKSGKCILSGEQTTTEVLFAVAY